MKLLGWIKSAVEFVKMPASPRRVGPQPQAPHAIDSHAAPKVAGADETQSRPESRISVAPEGRISIESETRTGAQPESRTVVESESSPNQQELDRRRGIVREFFNDYWASADDKPASFAERLDKAEGYINERVAAGGEAWRLGPATRKQLGLPPSRNR